MKVPQIGDKVMIQLPVEYVLGEISDIDDGKVTIKPMVTGTDLSCEISGLIKSTNGNFQWVLELKTEKLAG